MKKACVVCGTVIDKKDSVAVTIFLCSEECKKIRKQSLPKKISITSTEYWIKQGLTESEATEKVSQLQKERSPRCVEYWIKRGHTLEESQIKVSEHQSGVSKRRLESMTSLERKQSSRCSVEYWKARGYNASDAKKIVSENSNTVSLRAFISRHGKEKGYKEWKKLCDSRKRNYTLAGYIQKHGEEEGRRLWSKKFKNRHDSKKAREFIGMLLDHIPMGLKYYWAGNETGEYGILGDDSYYFYDLVIPELGIAIEYNGDYWHCNPEQYNSDFMHPHLGITAKEIWKKDTKKRSSLKEKRGYDTIVVWESDNTKESIEMIKEKIHGIFESKNQK